MSTWKQMIADAKELLDMGAITQEEFEQSKREAFALRSQSTQVENTATLGVDELSGETQMFTGTESVEDELSADPLAGATQFVPEVEIDGLMPVTHFRVTHWRVVPSSCQTSIWMPAMTRSVV